MRILVKAAVFCVALGVVITSPVSGKFKLKALRPRVFGNDVNRSHLV